MQTWRGALARSKPNDDACASRSSNHLPELDGIRGLAILGVLLSHGVGLPGIFDAIPGSISSVVFRYIAVPLWGGVDLFFVLSGFLITGILLKTKHSKDYFSSFYARRVLRIFPIYYLTLISSLVLGRFSTMIHSLLPPYTSLKVAYFLYLQNWPNFWHGQPMLSGLWGAYWSLAIEEQFYMVWPLLVAVLPEPKLFKACIVGIILALSLRILLSLYYSGINFGLAQMSTCRVDGLLAGAACAIYMSEKGRPVPIKWIVIFAAVGVTLIGYISVFHTFELIWTKRWMLTVGITSFALLSTALVAVSQYHFPLVQRFLATRLLREAGKYSYGMYVYHLLVLLPLHEYVRSDAGKWARASFGSGILFLLLELMAVFLIGKLSYELLEVHFLSLKRHLNPLSSREESEWKENSSSS